MGQSKPFHRTAIVVEDDALQRDMIALLLEESDFNVIQCEDAETASLALKARHPCLLITDVKLAGKMNGIELAQLARQQAASVLPDGVTFLSKPVHPTTLIREAVP